MIRFLADENLNADIVRGVVRRGLEVSIVSVHEVGLAGADDSTVLDWAAREDHIVLTHDANTMPRFAYERVVAGLPMPGVFIIAHSVPVRRAIDDIVLLAESSLEGEWRNQVRFLPL